MCYPKIVVEKVPYPVVQKVGVPVHHHHVVVKKEKKEKKEKKKKKMKKSKKYKKKMKVSDKNLINLFIFVEDKLMSCPL